jgi:hypothetical protein
MDAFTVIDTIAQILTIERGEYAMANARFEAAKENLEYDKGKDAYARAEERHRELTVIWDKLQILEESLPPREAYPLAWLVRPIAVDRVKKAALGKKIAETEAAIAAIEKEHSWKWAAAAKGPKRVSPLVIANREILELNQEELKKVLVSLDARETILKRHIENTTYIDALFASTRGEGPIPQRYLAEEEAKRLLFLKENPPWIPTGPMVSDRLVRMSMEKNMA